MATYIVKKGDSLSTIAKKFGMTDQELMKENNINPNRKYIYAGDAINVIDHRSAEAKANAPLPEVNNKVEEYIVQKGDNYYTISQKYKISLADLMELNNKDPFFDDLILPGDVIKVIDRNHAEKVMANCTKNTKSSTGSCPKQQPRGIFPVRYALDENQFLTTRVIMGDVLENTNLELWNNFISNQGVRPLPREWQSAHLPKLNTRAYTLRQLRKGWLYVWTKEKGLEEYTVTPSQDGVNAPVFTKIDLEANQGKDERAATGEAKTILYIDPVTAYFAYSSVQWTYSTCTEVQEALKQGKKDTPYTKWMRSVNLQAQTKQPHTGSLSEIANVVADIYGSDPITVDFSASINNSLAKEDGDNDYLVYRVQDQTIQAKSDDKNADLFIALDDPLAIIDDLLLGLSFPVTAKEHYEEINQRKTQIAEIGYPIIGLGIEDFIPDKIKQDPEQKYKYIKDVFTTRLMHTNASAQRDQKQIEQENRIQELQGTPTGGLPSGNIRANGISELYRSVKEFTAIWGENNLPKSKTTQKTKKDGKEIEKEITFIDKCIEYDNILTLRWKFRAADALAHLENRAKTFKVYDQCIEKAVEDTIAWLNLLTGDAFSLCFDTSNEAHSEALYTHGLKILQLLQYHGKGSEWFLAQYKKPTTVFGLNLFNFNQKLHAFFVKLANEISKDNSAGGVKGIQMDKDLAYNIFSRVNDTYGILSNEHVKDLPFFKDLDDSTKAVYSGLQKMRTGVSSLYEKTIINGLAYLANLHSEELLPYAAVTTLATNEQQHIVKSMKFSSEFLDWMNDVHTLETSIKKLSDTNIELSQTKKPEGLTPSEIAALRRERKLQIAANKAERELLKKQLHQLKAKKPIALIAYEGTVETFKGTADFMYKQSGQTKAMEVAWDRVENAYKAKVATGKFIDKYGSMAKGNMLAIVQVLWNLYNTKDALKKMKQEPNAKHLLNVASTIGYLGQSVMTLWMGPVWDRYYKLVATKLKKVNAIRVINGEQALEMTIRNIAAQRKALATLAPKILVKVGVLNVFIGVGAIGELLSAEIPDFYNSSNTAETFGHYVKMGSLSLTVIVGILGGLNALAMLLFNCAWMMGPLFSVALFGASIAYLLSTLWIMYFHREGIALWLDDCVWGTDKWKGAMDRNTQIEELKALYQIILEPAVHVAQTRELREVDQQFHRLGYQTTGFWLQLSLPAELKNEAITLKTLLVKGQGVWWWNTPLAENYQRLMNRIETDGTWSSPLTIDNLGKSLPESPQTPEQRQLDPFDYDAMPEIDRYVYTVWLPYEDYGLETFFDLKIELPFNTEQASLMNAPGLETSSPTKAILDYNFEHKLTIGFTRYSMGSVPPLNCETLKQKKANEVYINNPSYNKDTMTYTIKVGQTLVEQKS